MKRIVNTLALLVICLQAVAQNTESTASIYLKAGMGTRLGKAGGDTELDRQHSQKMSKGYSLQLELILNNPSIITYGFMVNDFHSTAKDRVVATYSDGSQATGDMIDIVDIWLFAPSVYIRGITLGDRLRYSLGVGTGPMGLRNKGSLLDDSVIKSGWCLGGVTGVGLDYILSPAFSIGLSTNLIVGDLTSYKTKVISTGNVQKTTNVHEAISHIDAMVAISYAF